MFYGNKKRHSFEYLLLLAYEHRKHPETGCFLCFLLVWIFAHKNFTHTSDTKKIEWFSFLKEEISEISEEVKDFFERLKNAPDLKITDERSFLDLAEGIGKSDENFKSFLKTTQESGTVYHTAEEALASYQAYLESTTKSTKLAASGTKALSAAMKVLSSIAWMAIISAITWAIGKAIGWIDDLIVTSKELAEKVENAKQSFQSASQAARDNSKNMEELSSEYEKLSKGVDNFGNNVSLTTDEYSRYNDIVNQIADMFPNLIQGYTKENNAILTLKGNIEGLTAAYKERNEEAYNNFLYGGKDVDGSADDLMEQSYRQLNKYANINKTFGFEDFLIGRTVSDSIDLSAKKRKEVLEEMYAATNSTFDFYKFLEKIDRDSDSVTKYGVNRMLPELAEMNWWEKQWFKKNSQFEGKSLEGFELDSWKELGFDKIKELQDMGGDFEDERLETIKKNIHDELIRTQKELDEYVNNTSLVANAYLATDSTYETLDENLKSAASIIINNISEATAMGFEGSKEKVQEWVSQITTLLAENKTIQDALVGLFSLNLNELSIPSAKQLVDIYISNIAEEMGKTEEEIAEIFGFKDFYSTANNYQSVLEKSAIKFSGASAYDVSNLTERGQKYIDIYDKLNSAASDLGINTQDEIALLSQCVEETSSWEEAIELCKKKIHTIAGEGTFSNLFALEDSNGELTKLGELSEQLDNIQNAYKTLSEAVNEYQTNGSYSVDTLQKIMELGDDWLDYLVDENGELKLDTEAVEGLASARLNEMKIRVQNSLFDQISQIKNETDANKFLASTNYELADSISAVAKSKTLESLKDADISDETYAAVVEALEKRLEVTNKLFDNTSASISAIGGTNMSSVMSSISSCADLISNVNKELAENGEISFDTLQSIAGSYPELEKYVNNYMGGVEGSQEALVEALNNHYQTELDNYYNYYVDKMTYDSNYWKEVYKQLPNQVQKLAETYKVDLINCSRYGDAKEKILENINEAQNKLSILSKVKTGTLANKKDELISYWEGVLKDNEALLHEIEAYFDLNIDDLDEKFNNLSYMSGNSSPGSSSNDPKIFDWIETKIDRLNTRLDSLKNNANNVYSSWGSRTKALNSAIQTTTEAIEFQRQAYNAYMKEADSVGLPEHYKRLVQNGALSIKDVTDSDIADQISEYQDLYEKAISCSDTVAELEQSLNELSFNTRWENIKTELDSVVSVFDADIDLIQTKLDALEIRGLFANASYYTEMSALTQRKLDTLNSEAAQLKSIMSAMPQNDEGYDTMLSELMDINKEIAELENNCIEFNNNIRDLDWEIFEYLEKSINRITDETEYLIGLLENENLFDEGGNFTEYADAALGLHSAAYEAYKRQAQDYSNEVRELQKQLVDGAGQEVLEHYNEIVDAHRDAVSAAESEKQAILDLIEDGYGAQLDALEKLIDKKKEQLDTEKNLYDYQKSIAEKTANVSSLEKQMLAYTDDDSEEAMSRIQQLKVELEEAKTDLAETEYEQYLQDTEDMLDKLSEDYENWINSRLDNEDALLSEIIGTVADKGDQINATLNEIAAKNDTFISDSIRGIFDADQPFAAVMNGIKDAVTGVGTAISDLQYSISGTTGADRKTSTSGKSPAPASADNKNKTSIKTNGGGKNPSSLADAPSGRTGADASGSGSWGSWFVKKNDAYSKNKLNKDTSIVDRLKYFNIDPEFSKRAAYYKAMGGSGSYISSASQNVWMLNQMKAHGYKNGSHNAAGGWRWTQENGGEFILRKSDGAMFTPLNKGDMVFSNESSKRLYEFAENPEAFMKKYNIDAPAVSPAILHNALENRLPSLPNAAQRSASVPINIGGINITCNEVNNARELMEDVTNQLIKNNRFGNAMSTMINNQIMGKNPLEHLKYVKH